MNQSPNIALYVILYVIFVAFFALYTLVRAERRATRQYTSRQAHTKQPLKDALLGIVFGLIWAAPIVGAVAVGSQYWWRAYSLQQRGMAVEATVLDAGVGTRSTQFVVYEYQVLMPNNRAGLVRQRDTVTEEVYEEATRLLRRAEDSNTRPTIPVLYLPDRPTFARIKAANNPATPFWHAVSTIGALAISMIWIVVGIAAVMQVLALRPLDVCIVGSSSAVFLLLLTIVLWVSQQ